MTTITVEALVVNGAPQAGITVGGLDAGDQVISVQVSVDGGMSYLPVSGGARVIGAGGKFVRDYFPPLNLASQYRVTEHSVAGEPTTESDPFTVTSESSWLQDPLNPRDGVELIVSWPEDDESMLVDGSLVSAEWAQSVDYALPIGADRPVGSFGQRQVAGQVPLRVAQSANEDRGKFRRMLLSSGSLVLRLDHPSALDPVAHVAIGDAQESIFRPADLALSTWDLTVTQVRRTSTAIVIPFYTYADVRAMWPTTYADVLLARPNDDYISWQRDPRP